MYQFKEYTFIPWVANYANGCMIYTCGVLNFLTDFTDQLHGSKESAFHLIKAERYEGYGLLKWHQMPNIQT